MREVNLAVRLLRRRPFYTGAIVLSLALGIGLHTAALCYFDALFLAPVPGVRDPARAVLIAGRGVQGGDWLPISYDDYRELAAASRTLAATAAYQEVRAGVEIEGSREPMLGEIVTPGFFEVLGLHPFLGRTLKPEAGKPEDPYTVVLSYELWQSRFARNPRVLGKKLRINHNPFTVVGVAAQGFGGVDARKLPRFWVPLSAYTVVLPEPAMLLQPGNRMLFGLGRLAPGANLPQATQELKGIAAHLEEGDPADGDRSMVLSPLTTRVTGPRGDSMRRGALLVLLLATTFLLVACGNVVNLQLIRGLERSHEFAVRFILGVSKALIARQLLVESLVLSLLGGGCALLVAAGFRKLIVLLKPPVLQGLAGDPLLGTRGMVFLLLLTLAVSLFLVGALALPVFERRLLAGLKAADTTSSPSRSLGVLGRSVFALQALLCTASLACAGQFLTSLVRQYRIDPGFERSNLLLVSLEFKAAGTNERRGRVMQDDLLAGLESSAAVHAAALSENRLLGGFGVWRNVSPADATFTQDPASVASEIVSPSYFQTVGISILRGRAFDSKDSPVSPPRVIVSESLGRQLWPGQDPVGRYIRLDKETSPLEVIGVAGDARYLRLTEPPVPVLYLSSSQRYLPRAFLNVRPAGYPREAIRTVQQSLKRLNGVLVGQLQGVSEIVDQSLWLPRTSSALLSILALLALVLTSIGMTGVAARLAHQRRRELAIRTAVGASSLLLVRALVARDLLAALVGIFAGAATAIWIHLRIASLLYDPGHDTRFILVSSSCLTLTMAFFATTVPAAQVARLDPTPLLRS
jgi:putative ABC transport system permease protein